MKIVHKLWNILPDTQNQKQPIKFIKSEVNFHDIWKAVRFHFYTCLIWNNLWESFLLLIFNIKKLNSLDGGKRFSIFWYFIISRWISKNKKNVREFLLSNKKLSLVNHKNINPEKFPCWTENSFIFQTLCMKLIMIQKWHVINPHLSRQASKFSLNMKIVCYLQIEKKNLILNGISLNLQANFMIFHAFLKRFIGPQKAIAREKS